VLNIKSDVKQPRFQDESVIPIQGTGRRETLGTRLVFNQTFLSIMLVSFGFRARFMFAIMWAREVTKEKIT